MNSTIYNNPLIHAIDTNAQGRILALAGYYAVEQLDLNDPALSLPFIHLARWAAHLSIGGESLTFIETEIPVEFRPAIEAIDAYRKSAKFTPLVDEKETVLMLGFFWKIFDTTLNAFGDNVPAGQEVFRIDEKVKIGQTMIAFRAVLRTATVQTAGFEFQDLQMFFRTMPGATNQAIGRYLKSDKDDVTVLFEIFHVYLTQGHLNAPVNYTDLGLVVRNGKGVEQHKQPEIVGPTTRS